MIATQVDTENLALAYNVEATSDLLCWQNALTNFVRIAMKEDDPANFPNLIFVTKDDLFHTYLVHKGVVYNTYVTWFKKGHYSTYYSLEDLKRLMEKDYAFEITATCIKSQLDYYKDEGGDCYWGPIRNLSRRINCTEEDLTQFLETVSKMKLDNFLEKYP